MDTIDWLWIVHPTLAVVLVYPLIGVVIRLAIQTRQRRLEGAPLPPGVGRDHADLGQWLAVAVVVVVLIALTIVIATKQPLAQFPGGASLALQLLLVLIGTLVALVALWRVHHKALRLSFALITWAGVLGLGAQPQVFRLSDNPLDPQFWQSHYWAGVAVVGLMLFSLAARPEILRQRRWRRLHVAANLLAAVLFAIQGLTGSRDLLTIPLHWQQGILQRCDWQARVCPSPSPAPPTAPPPLGDEAAPAAP